MTAAPDSLPKDVKVLPAEAQQVWLHAYNEDFGWRCSESHAAKAAWRALLVRFGQEQVDRWQKAAEAARPAKASAAGAAPPAAPPPAAPAGGKAAGKRPA